MKVPEWARLKMKGRKGKVRQCGALWLETVGNRRITLFVETVRNRRITPWGKNVLNRRIQFIDMNLFPLSSGVSEQTSKRMSACGAHEAEASSPELCE